nr:hypothetical protein [uncultured Flavobacterium sp.]
MYTRHTFHNKTYCLFQQVALDTLPKTNPDYTSASGSKYYFTDEGVFRVATHWGRAANCRWRLIANTSYQNQQQACGYARWVDFQPNNEHEKLFYITIDWVKQTATFYHKNDPSYAGQLCRTANETAKRLQKITQILQHDDWKKHCTVYDYDVAKQLLLDKLITTNSTVFQLIQEINHSNLT